VLYYYKYFSQISAVNKNNTPWTKFQKDAMLYILTDIFLKSKILKKDSIILSNAKEKAGSIIRCSLNLITLEGI
jgi:hypothetical protein